MPEPENSRHFTGLTVWKLAREVRNGVYAVAKMLPGEEKYVLGSQIRRAAISITANIAEGYHFQENIQFCRQSRGSLFEIQDHLITCLDQNYISKDQFDKIWLKTENTAKALNGYIRWLKKQKNLNTK